VTFAAGLMGCRICIATSPARLENYAHGTLSQRTVSDGARARACRSAGSAAHRPRSRNTIEDGFKTSDNIIDIRVKRVFCPNTIRASL